MLNNVEPSTCKTHTRPIPINSVTKFEGVKGEKEKGLDAN